MSLSSSAVPGGWAKKRLTGVAMCVLLAFAVLFGRLFYLQVLVGEEYRRLSENNCIRLQGISPTRGLIYDRNGVLIADNRPSFDLGIVLKDAAPLKETIRRLTVYTRMSEGEIKDIIAKAKVPSYRMITLKRDIERNVLAAVEAHKFELPGVQVKVQPKRHYLQQIAPHLIGYLGEVTLEELESGKYPENQGGDYIGKDGIEKAAESYLRGESGGRQVEVNARGQVVRVLDTVDAVPGDNLYLTIDLRMQQKAEALLTGLVGAVVAVESHSGKIVAMACSPSFDQHRFINGMSRREWHRLKNDESRPLRNKAVCGLYPPASTYKIITAMAGLEEGVIDENTTFFCPGYYRFGDRTFRCWRKWGHGNVNVTEALAVSCDVFFYQVGQRLGVDRLAQYAKKCGLGSRTGVILPHESGGLIPTAEWKKRRFGIPWQKGETLSIAIGQGYNLTTPLQMAMVAAAVGNGGTIYKPKIVEKIDDVRRQQMTILPKEVVGQLPVSQKTLDIVKKGLWRVVNGKKGTARLAHVEGLSISGKTGTAQVFSRKKNDKTRRKVFADHLKPHAWFVAYGEPEEGGGQQLAVSVIIEHGEHGSSTAAPIARELIKWYFFKDTPVERKEP